MNKITGSKLLKNINRRKILETLIQHKTISRASISKITKLNKATISEQIGYLIDESLVIEELSSEHRVGRRPIMLSINGNAGYAIGIDLDSHHIHGLLIDFVGNIHAEEKIVINSSSEQNVISLIISVVEKLLSFCKDTVYGVVGIAIGIHSIVDNHNTVAFDSSFNWESVDLVHPIEKHFNIPTTVDNNNNLSVYAIKTFFADIGNLIGINLSSGIGSGIYINNSVYSGYDGFAGEVGHMIIKEDGPLCPCGNRGCWELFASEKAIYKKIAELRGLEKCSEDQLANFIYTNDREVIQILEQMAYYLYIGISNIIKIFNPGLIVIDSKLVSIYPRILELINEKLETHMNFYCKVTLSKFETNSCCLGGAALSINKFLDISNVNIKQKGTPS